MRTASVDLDFQEDNLARKEYGMEFTALPGDIKQAIHNVVLEKNNLRHKFKFVCSVCNKPFEDTVEGAHVRHLKKLQAEQQRLSGICSKCKKKKDAEQELIYLGAEWKKIFDKDEEMPINSEEIDTEQQNF